MNKLVLEGENLHQLGLNSLSELYHNGDTIKRTSVIKDRNTGGSKRVEVEIKEKMPAYFELKNPKRNLFTWKGRKENPFLKIWEFFWIIDGRNDTFLSSIITPNILTYCDDPRLVRGAYGPRLMNWGVESDKTVWDRKHNGGLNQIETIIERLKKDNSSRQNVALIWDPAKDNIPVTMDRPCNNYFGFCIGTDGKLHARMVVRSNDALWGFLNVNATVFTLIQTIVAESIGVPVGSYLHEVLSFHMYRDMAGKTNYEPIPTILKKNDPQNDPLEKFKELDHKGTTLKDLYGISEMIQNMYILGVEKDLLDLSPEEWNLSPYWMELIQSMAIHACYKRNQVALGKNVKHSNEFKNITTPELEKKEAMKIFSSMEGRCKKIVEHYFEEINSDFLK